jgi:hypothetical protein
VFGDPKMTLRCLIDRPSIATLLKQATIVIALKTVQHKSERNLTLENYPLK